MPAPEPPGESEPTASAGMSHGIRRRPLVVFFLPAFALTWVVWVPRAIGVDLGVVGRLWTWMPAVAAMLSAAVTGGRTAVRRVRRLMRWRVGWRWYVVVILAPAAFSAATAAVYILLGGSWSAAAPNAFTTSLTMLALFLLVLTLTDGLGEEPAWRGFALPRLLSRHNALIGSLVLGVLWWF